jgi:hypothetical protein
MNRIVLLFISFFCLSNTFQTSAQTTIRMFDNELFIDGYKNADLVKYNDSLPPSANVLRLRTSLVTKKFSITQLASLGNSLSLKVIIKASCDNYDRGGHVNLAFVPKGKTTYVIDSSVKRIEIARFITPFMDKNKKPDTVPYYYEMNNIAWLLKEKSISDSFDVWCELEIFGVSSAANTQITGCANRTDVFFGTVEFTTNTPSNTETNNVFIPLGNQLSLNNYQAKATDLIGTTTKTISFNLNAKSYQTKLYLITSNHGANSGGEEYNRRYHYIYLDNKKIFEYIPGEESCEPYRKYNTQANGIYSAKVRTDDEWQSFSNWCPGASIPTRIIYLETLDAGAHTFKIDVPEAKFAGSQGNIPLSVYLHGKTSFVVPVNEIIELNTELKLYPNPVKDELLTIVSKSEVINYLIFNSVGKEVLRGTSSNINVANLNTGVYYLKATFLNGFNTVKAFIKQ